jgi:hypothetical protein
MRRTAVTVMLAAALFMITSGLTAQQVLYEEYFTGGTTDLEWTSAWSDSAGNPLNFMEVDSVDSNPSGDGWIGVATGDTASLGGLGLLWSGEFDLMDYSIEAEVLVNPNSGFYEGVMVKIDTTGGVVKGYQLVSNFNPMFGAERIRFRYYESLQPNIIVLAEWSGADIPGGPPTEESWHHLELRVQNFEFRCFWDRQELSGGPFFDTTLPEGPFGIYAFDMMDLPRARVDDIVVRSYASGIEEPGEENSIPKALALGQNYPNPFNPSTVIPLSISSSDGAGEQHVKLSIFDLRGREVRRLIDRPMPEGNHKVHWDGKDTSGGTLPSGVYIYRLKSGNETETRKMILAR